MANTSSYTGGMLHGAAGLAGPQEQQDYDSVPVDELYGEDAQQQQQHSQPPSQSQHHEGGEGAASAELDDFMSHQLHQLLIKDMATFWANTVAPTTQSIAQVSGELTDVGSWGRHKAGWGVCVWGGSGRGSSRLMMAVVRQLQHLDASANTCCCQPAGAGALCKRKHTTSTLAVLTISPNSARDWRRLCLHLLPTTHTQHTHTHRTPWCCSRRPATCAAAPMGSCRA